MWKKNKEKEKERPAGAYPLRDFHKICRVCTPVQAALGVKIWLDLLKGLWSYGGFKLRGSGCPQIFSAPSGETMHQTPNVLETQERARGPLSPCQVWWGSDFTRRQGVAKNVEFFVCLSVVRHAFECLRLCARFRHACVGVRNDFDAVG